MIWYLIMNFSHGGALAIPEPTQVKCLEVIQQLKHDRSVFSALALDMYCVPGLPAGASE